MKTLYDLLRDLIEAVHENTKEQRRVRREMLQQQLGEDRLLDREDMSVVLGKNEKWIYNREREGRLRPGNVGQTKVYSLGAAREHAREAAEGDL